MVSQDCSIRYMAEGVAIMLDTVRRPEAHVTGPDEAYTKEDHWVWNTLIKRVLQTQKGRFCRTFEENVIWLGMLEGGIPPLPKLNARLYWATRWSLDPTIAYAENEKDFLNFAKRRFPAIAKIRGRDEIDRAKAPDLFHDYCGHLWMLTDPDLASLMEAFGRQSIKVSGTPAFKALSRLYLNTIEFGLQRKEGKLEGFGAALASSPEELRNATEGKPLRVRFDAECEEDVARIMRTDFHFSDLQETYFVNTNWPAFHSLMRSDLSPYYKNIAGLPLLAPGERCDSDVLIAG